jgi:hypothetical protein
VKPLCSLPHHLPLLLRRKVLPSTNLRDRTATTQAYVFWV